ncbi:MULTISPECIES: YoaK family protein [Bacteria]|uniref:YoaK family protein n=1 Tax=Bacteria TaxID=2 RepID=UPI003C7A527F
MREVSRRGVALSVALSLVAGYVDALGFIETGGLFVSFMSGNSTQVGVELWGGEAVAALLPLALVGSFVLGVTGGALVAGAEGRRRGFVVGAAAVAVAVSATLGLAETGAPWRFALLALAMGSLNTLYLAEGRARVAITYATGTLVSLGLAIAALVTGRDRRAWRRPLLLWSALAAGAVIGAAAHRWTAAGALVAAALALGVLAAGIVVMARPRSIRAER